MAMVLMIHITDTALFIYSLLYVHLCVITALSHADTQLQCDC